MTTTSIVLIGLVVAAAMWVVLPRLRQLRVLYAPRSKPARHAALTREDAALYLALQATSEETVDDRTWRDLMMDDVFPAIDRTSSVIGRQTLYHRLRIQERPSEHSAVLRQRLARFASSPDTFERLSAWMDGFRGDGHPHLAHFIFAEDHRRRRIHVVLPALFVVSVTALVSGLVWPPAFLGLAIAGLVNVTVRIWLQPSIQAFLTPFRAVHGLLDCADALREMEGGSSGALEPAVRTNVFALRRTSRVVSWSGRGEEDLLRVLFEYLALVFCIDGATFTVAAPMLRRAAGCLRRQYLYIGEVELALCAHRLRREMPWCCEPRWKESGPLVLRGLWHPLIQDPVPNDVTLVPGHGMLLTGPHMGGKSTLLRSIGVAVLCGRALETCPARSAELPWATMWTSMTHDDSLVESRSYHLTETRRLVQLLEAASRDHPCLLLLDEPMRGTNAAERIAIVATILDHLTSRGHLVLATTHDFELQALLRRTYEAYHLGGEVGEEASGYTLRAGPARPRTALALLEQCGAPPQIVRNAAALCETLLEQDRRLPGLRS